MYLPFSKNILRFDKPFWVEIWAASNIYRLIALVDVKYIRHLNPRDFHLKAL